MRVKMIVAALVIMAMMAVSAAAQAPAKPFDIYVGGGLSMPTGTLGDGWKMGFHGNGKIAFAISPMFDIVGNVAFHTFSIDDMGSGVDGGSASAIMIGGDARYKFAIPESNVAPYVLGGAGIGIAKIGDVTIPGFGTIEGDSESKPYFNFGGGVEVQKFFAEVKYVIISTSGESFSFLPITIGVKF